MGDKHRSIVEANGVVTQREIRADGTMQLFYPGGTDGGTWRLDDKGYCTIWRKMRECKQASLLHRAPPGRQAGDPQCRGRCRIDDQLGDVSPSAQ
ncbi:hypothetical protein OOZ63_21420 [Paucibacter sp. PLA-PC-4]|uniref:hypothetical protein n=1 Tax=Paucibacter sp. PLA-PC-4 TaxID=2993655 RepID=UPI00224B4A1B|nr:hypothetical protein [Paucibacter sp. PLA-PC-4]MCX2864392.1 hypothetical protein [Paucibacter sp. PLA-PC-4]